MPAIECPHCRMSTTVHADAIGVRVTCQFCKQSFIANPLEAPAITMARPMPPKKREEADTAPLAEQSATTDPEGWPPDMIATCKRWLASEKSTKPKTVVSIVVGLFCAIGFLSTIGTTPHTWWAAWHYLSLLLTVGIATWLACRYAAKWLTFLNRWGWLVAYVAPVVVACFWGWRDNYEERWTSDRGTKFTDTRKRWSGRLYYRQLNIPAKNSFGFDAEGPMSPSGKPHGEWIEHDWEARQKEHAWYWYGEKISEGEWHLRTR